MVQNGESTMRADLAQYQAAIEADRRDHCCLLCPGVLHLYLDSDGIPFLGRRRIKGDGVGGDNEIRQAQDL